MRKQAKTTTKKRKPEAANRSDEVSEETHSSMTTAATAEIWVDDMTVATAASTSDAIEGRTKRRWWANMNFLNKGRSGLHGGGGNNEQRRERGRKSRRRQQQAKKKKATRPNYERSPSSLMLMAINEYVRPFPPEDRSLESLRLSLSNILTYVEQQRR